jgi:hypothetical protein
MDAAHMPGSLGSYRWTRQTPRRYSDFDPMVIAREERRGRIGDAQGQFWSDPWIRRRERNKREKTK